MARYGLSGGVSTTGSKLTNSIIYTFHPQGTFLTNAQVHWDSQHRHADHHRLPTRPRASTAS